jgi:hypothetical protein
MPKNRSLFVVVSRAVLVLALVGCAIAGTYSVANAVCCTKSLTLCGSSFACSRSGATCTGGQQALSVSYCNTGSSSGYGYRSCGAGSGTQKCLSTWTCSPSGDTGCAINGTPTTSTIPSVTLSNWGKCDQ